MNNRLFLFAAALGCFSNPAAADTLSHDYLEAAWSVKQIDTGSKTIEGTGFLIDFSKDIFGSIYLLANYNQYQFDDVDNYDIKQYMYSLGAGYRYEFSWRLDVYGQLAYVGIECDLADEYVKDNGINARVGIRAVPFGSVEALEVEAYFDYLNYDNQVAYTEYATSAGVLARWHFNDTISVGGGVVGIGESTAVGFLSFRVDFGKMRIKF